MWLKCLRAPEDLEASSTQMRGILSVGWETNRPAVSVPAPSESSSQPVRVMRSSRITSAVPGDSPPLASIG